MFARIGTPLEYLHRKAALGKQGGQQGSNQAGTDDGESGFAHVH